MVNQGHFGTGIEVDPGLATQAEPLLLQIPPQIIQEGGNIQEYQQGHKTPPVFRLYIWEVPQEAMEDQRKNLRLDNQESLGYYTRDHYLD